MSGIPHDTVAEAGVLSAAVQSRDALAEALALLRPDQFYSPKHALVFGAMGRLSAAGEPVDEITLVEALRSSGDLSAVGGVTGLTQLLGSFSVPANVGQYARTVADTAGLRVLLAVLTGAVAEIRTGQAGLDGMIETILQQVREVPSGAGLGEMRHLGEAIKEQLAAIEYRFKHPGELAGLRTGLPDIDEALDGLEPGKLYVIGARPGMGKTALAINAADHVAAQGTPVGVFSLEMPEAELAQREIAQLGPLAMQEKIKKARLNGDDWAKLGRAVQTGVQRPIYVQDKAGLELAELRSQASKAQRKHKIGVFFVDYLQLVKHSQAQSRVLEVGAVAQGLKDMAKDLAVPVVALAQLNRKVEERTDKRPQLNDLRDSGEIEQAADAVIGLYRHGYYHPDCEDPNEAEAWILKQRAGVSNARVVLHWDGPTMRFRSAVRGR